MPQQMSLGSGIKGKCPGTQLGHEAEDGKCCRKVPQCPKERKSHLAGETGNALKKWHWKHLLKDEKDLTGKRQGRAFGDTESVIVGNV